MEQCGTRLNTAPHLVGIDPIQRRLIYGAGDVEGHLVSEAWFFCSQKKNFVKKLFFKTQRVMMEDIICWTLLEMHHQKHHAGNNYDYREIWFFVDIHFFNKTKRFLICFCFFL